MLLITSGSRACGTCTKAPAERIASNDRMEKSKVSKSPSITSHWAFLRARLARPGDFSNPVTAKPFFLNHTRSRPEAQPISRIEAPDGRAWRKGPRKGEGSMVKVRWS